MSVQTSRNKQTAMAFYDLMFNQCRPAEAIDCFLRTRMDVLVLGSTLCTRQENA